MRVRWYGCGIFYRRRISATWTGATRPPSSSTTARRLTDPKRSIWSEGYYEVVLHADHVVVARVLLFYAERADSYGYCDVWLLFLPRFTIFLHKLLSTAHLISSNNQILQNYSPIEHLLFKLLAENEGRKITNYWVSVGKITSVAI